MKRLSASFALLFAALACTEPNPEYQPPMSCDSGESAYLQSFSTSHPRKLDLVLVVDNQPGSEALLQELRASTRAIVNAVSGLDFRIAVLPTSSKGRLNIPTSCPGEVWIDANTRNPDEALQCLLQVPIVNELPVAIEGLLSIPPTMLRDDAKLLALFITLRDDCSNARKLSTPLESCEWQRDQLSSVAELASALRATRADLEATAVGVISGPNDALVYAQGSSPSASCQSPLGEALHAPRLHELAAHFEHRGAVESVCSLELATPLSSLIERLAFPTELAFCLGRQSSGGLQSVTLLMGDERVEWCREEAQHCRLGVSARCPNGELLISPAPSSADPIEVVFCGPSE